MKNKIAFTLAEMLIVLSIIGFVAAVSIPAMFQDIKRTQYETGAQQVYASLNGTFKKLNVDYQCDNDLRCTGMFNTGTTSQTLGTEIKKYYKVVKDCGVSTTQDCWPDATNNNFDGSSATNINFNTVNSPIFYKFITADGKVYAIHNFTEDYAAGCSNNMSTGALGANSFMSQACGIVYVDMNGYKEPNNLGKDTFMFFITNGKGPLLYPAGGIDDNYLGVNNYWNLGSRNYCDKTTNKSGIYCTGRLAEKSFRMDYY